MSKTCYIISNLLIFTFLVTSPAVANFTPHAKINKNCSDNQYLNLNNGLCQNLLTNFGFKGFDSPSNIIETCSNREFSTNAAQGNVHIKLPIDCVIDLHQGVNIGSNTIIQGNVGVKIVGTDEPADGIAGLLQVSNVKNVVIKDIEIVGEPRGNLRPLRGVEIISSKNVLVENIKIQNTEYQGIRCAEQPNGENISIVKNYINNVYEWHGIACGHGNKNILIASNLVEKTSTSNNYPGYGLDIVTNQTEVAGNLIDKKDTGSGVKVPGTQDLVFHHNVIKNAVTYPGIRTYEGNNIKPNNHYYFNNNILEGDIILTDAEVVGLANNNVRGYKNGSAVKTCTSTPNTNYKVVDSIVFNYGRGKINICDLQEPPATPTEPTPTPSIDLSFDHTGDGVVDIRDILELVRYIFR